MARPLLDRLVPDGPVQLVGGGTADGYKGPRVYGKGRHRAPVRSTHSYTAWRSGHRWVVLAVLVKFPSAARRWAPPALVDLYRPPEVSRAVGRRHRTPAQLMCRLLRLLLLRFPDRAVVFAGDSGYGTHEVARFCHRHRDRLTPVSKCHPDVNLFAPPPPYAGNGRPRVKGERVPKPRQACETAPRIRLKVGWYGGARRVETATGTGRRYKGGCGLVPVRWVFVRDASGTRRGEYFFTTDPTPSPAAVIGHYCGRGNIETTFQEARSALGLESTRGRCRNTGPRAGPCLLGRYSVVSLLFDAPPESKRVGAVNAAGRATATFSDALCAVRRWLWAEAVLPPAGDGTALQELPEPVRELLLTTLAPAT